MNRGLVNLLLALVVALGVVWLVLLPPGLILRLEEIHGIRNQSFAGAANG